MALVNDADALAQNLCFLHAVCREHKGAITTAPRTQNDVPNLPPIRIAVIIESSRMTQALNSKNSPGGD